MAVVGTAAIAGDDAFDRHPGSARQPGCAAEWSHHLAGSVTGLVAVTCTDAVPLAAAA